MACLRRVHLRRVGIAGRVGEVEVVDPADRHDVEVDVGDLEAGDHQADTGRGEGGLLGPADVLARRS